MDTDGRTPIACTLQPGDYRERLAWIAELARDGLLGVSRDDLRLELKYAAPSSISSWLKVTRAFASRLRRRNERGK